MKKYGVIGFPIKQSFSPQYFANKFEKLGIIDCTYDAYEVESLSDLKKFASKNNLSGFNVTMPHKQAIIPHLDGISEAAVKINAVNTVTVREGKLYGDNTDHYGFTQSICGLMRAGKTKALIFGTGGSSLAVRYALNQMGVSYAMVSRERGADFTYDNLTEEDIRVNTLLINTTPLGMMPNTEACVAIPYQGIGEHHICYDLVYTPEETLFLKKANEEGATIKSGLQMLELQADKSWEIWNT